MFVQQAPLSHLPSPSFLLKSAHHYMEGAIAKDTNYSSNSIARLQLVIEVNQFPKTLTTQNSNVGDWRDASAVTLFFQSS